MNSVVLSKLFISRLKPHILLIDSINNPSKTKEDLAKIFEMIKKLKFFREFLTNTFQNSEFDILLSFCGSIHHEFFSQGDLIIKQNDVSNDKMYVILTGNVYVMKTKEKLAISSKIEKKLVFSPEIENC